jgi:glyoxylase-like metal-dependent hydrolase (beta-lactamase superfamily II)
MILEKMIVGRLQANCYIVGCENTKIGCIIDPGSDAEVIAEEVRKHQIIIKYIVNTHGHMDHVAANNLVQDMCGGKIVIHQDDAPMLDNTGSRNMVLPQTKMISISASQLLSDGDELQIGNLNMFVIHTPGHTPGGICLKINGHLFSGDTLFAGSVGRWDFAGGSYKDLMNSIKKLILLPESTIVYPGHGSSTTIGEEIKRNPFIKD